MFGQVSDLPHLANYTQALKKFNETKGIRGRTHIKPLKTNRRDPDSYQIKQNPLGGIECWLYQTPVLIYYPNELVINTFDSRTTCCFVDDIAPNGIWANQYQSTMVVSIMGEGQFIGSSIRIPMDENYLPIKGAVESYKLDQVVLNRTRAAEARKMCKDVIALAQVTSKLDGYWESLRASKEETDDENLDWLRRLLDIGGYSRRERWDGSMYHCGFGSWGERSAEDLLPRLKQRLYQRTYEQENCYDYIAAPYGVVPKNWRVSE